VAKTVPFDIIDGFNKSYYQEFNPQELINCFVVTGKGGSKGKAIFPSAGLNLTNGIKFSGTKKGRRSYKYNNNMYEVIGERVYKIDSRLNAILLGNLGTETGYVGIADNGRQLMFVDGTGGWIYNETLGTFTKINDPAFPATPQDVSVLADRFLVSLGTNSVLFSAMGDGTSWNALDKFAITSQPDNIVGLSRLNDRIFVMGERTTEVWASAAFELSDSSFLSFPFQRADVLPFGCSAIGSIKEAFGFLVWLTKDDDGVGSVVMTSGTQPQSISNKGILSEFAQYENVSDATSFIYRNEQGHVFYQINLTAENKSWAFDITESKWLSLTHEATNRHLAEDHVFFNNKHYIVAYNQPYVYQLSSKFYTDDGTTIRREGITPILADPTGNEITIHYIKFQLKQGVGSSTCGKDYTPQLRLQISRDNGLTYGYELMEPIGDIGQNQYETVFYRLGRAKSFVFKYIFDNNAPFVLLNAIICITVGLT